MSDVSKLINSLKRKLDNISGLSDDYVLSEVKEIEKSVNEHTMNINKYEKADPLNGSVFSKNKEEQ